MMAACTNRSGPDAPLVRAGQPFEDRLVHAEEPAADLGCLVTAFWSSRLIECKRALMFVC